MALSITRNRATRAQQLMDLLVPLYNQFGAADYLGEEVTQTTHALLAGKYAEEHKFDDELIVSALFHDSGHIIGLIAGLDDLGGFGIKDHEEIGANFLTKLGFGPGVTVPVLEHVAIKRYLRFKNPDYELSQGSEESLKRQGGPMTKEEAAAYEARLGPQMLQRCIQLRLCEEAAKDPKAPHADWAHYKDMVEKVLANAKSK